MREQEIATELMETRVNGYHARWPRDPDTTERLKRLGEERPSRFASWYWIIPAAVAVFVILIVHYLGRF